MSIKTDKPNAKDCSSAASPIPESRYAVVDTTWPENYDPPPKSKGKSVKLKKNAKTENSKKLNRQGSKDSVVLVGYKHLKAPYNEARSKYKEGDAPLNQEEAQDTLQRDSNSYLRTNTSFVYDSRATSTHAGNTAIDCVADDDIATAACPKGSYKNPIGFKAQNKPQAGTGAVATYNQPLHKDEHGPRQIQVKPSNKDPYQGDKVTVLLPCRTDKAPSGIIPEITQTDRCNSKQSVVDSVFERLGKEATQRSQHGLVSLQVKGDCIRLPDGVPSASSRLSDSGIESEPSSFAAQPVPGPQNNSRIGVAESDVGPLQPEKPLLSPALWPVQHSSVQKPSGVVEILNPESNSAVSEVQSSLTSINSLPSDDEGEGSSRGSSGAEIRCRKSSVLVQEQSLVFSGDSTNRPESTVGWPIPPQPSQIVACNPASAFGDSQLGKSAFEIETDSKLIGISELGLEGAAGSGAIRESHSESHTACPSSNSATSSTDLVKRGMVENYFGSCSSTDVSEISPVETSAITLGIQTGPQGEEDEDEAEHEMIENGYYEEGDGYAFVNGVADEEQIAVGGIDVQETSLLFEQLGLGYPPATMPTCSNLASSSVAYNLGRPPCLPTSSVHWYECAPAPQMKA